MRLCTITGIRLGDGDFGISPGEGEICMTLRAEIEDEMLAMEKSVLSYAAQAAETAGLKMTSSIRDYFPETRNHDACLDKVLEAARKNKIPAISMGELWRASEDFGHYLKICPGAMIYIGNGEDYPPLHTSEYDFNDRIIEPAVNLFTGIALSGIASD
jgi:metal-dependent amidase/aminoacylase/carboxypeptidase family protein